MVMAFWFQAYGNHCKKAKEDLKQSLIAHKKEKTQHKKVEELSGKERDVGSGKLKIVHVPRIYTGNIETGTWPAQSLTM